MNNNNKHEKKKQQKKEEEEEKKKKKRNKKSNDHPFPLPPHLQIRPAQGPRDSPSLLSANAGAMVYVIMIGEDFGIMRKDSRHAHASCAE